MEIPGGLHRNLNWKPIEEICKYNKIDIGLFRDQPEDNVGGLLAYWYFAHIKAGGKPHRAAESLMTEIETEDAFGLDKVAKSSNQLH